MIDEVIKHIVKNMKDRFIRSSLTIISIMIGIMAVFVLVSFGQGLTKYIDDISKATGTDKLIAQPKGFGAPGTTGTFLTKDDVDFFKRSKDVSESAGVIIGQGEVSDKEDKPGKWVFVMGMPTDPSEQRLVVEGFGGIGIGEGRDIKKGDKNKAVVGYRYTLDESMFPRALGLGDKIFVNNVKLEIVGFFEEIGNAQDDSNIYITQDYAKEFFDKGDEYAFVYIRADKGADPVGLAERLEEKLRKRKNQKEGEEDFYIQTFEQLLETFGTVLIVLNAILIIIAGISVLVAAVNIMNTMYTSILERTKEIGIMKAIGARNSFILKLFFLESGILGLIGGSIGILIGYGLAKLGGSILTSVGYSVFQPYFPLWLTISLLIFSFLVGAASGYFPARAASKLKPVDALRYE
jgi:putative ABC transport system permease protein